jgi:hypothetical protein
MKRQVIQNVLNLPGISGMALIDGRNRPFFFGPDIQLNSQQQDALAQGIQQVVDTTPKQFQAFAFRFTNQLTHIYKLDGGLILLVLISDQLALGEYRTAVDQLRESLAAAPHNAVPTFRLLAGCVTLGSGAMADMPPPAPVASAVPDGGSVAAALNSLSDGAVQYLGKIIVVNTWKQARPSQPWLTQFEIQKDGHFTYGGDGTVPLTSEQLGWVQEWAMAFLNRGSRTIRNFQTMVADQSLTTEQRHLLMPLLPDP